VAYRRFCALFHQNPPLFTQNALVLGVFAQFIDKQRNLNGYLIDCPVACDWDSHLPSLPPPPLAVKRGVRRKIVPQSIHSFTTIFNLAQNTLQKLVDTAIDTRYIDFRQQGRRRNLNRRNEDDLRRNHQSSNKRTPRRSTRHHPVGGLRKT